jgi:hypothetical protein
MRTSQRMLEPIATIGVDPGGRSLQKTQTDCESLGAGARPVHPIRVASLPCNDSSAIGG